VHVGARLANASVYLNTSLADLLVGVDSVSLCLSKGLGAPVGSVLAGSEDFIRKVKSHIYVCVCVLVFDRRQNECASRWAVACVNRGS
jgi:hypothetical protein